MFIEINHRNGSKSDALDAHIEQEVTSKIGRLSDRLTRIEVHVGDENAAKHGPGDKRCLMEARPRGLDPIVAEAHDDDFYKATTAAAKKLLHALEHKFKVN